MTELVYVLPFLIALALLVLILASADPGPRDPIIPFPRASADHLARAMRMRSVLVLAVIGALAAYNMVTADMIDMMKFSSPVYAIVAVAAIGRWVEARRALRMLALEDVTTSIVAGIVICESRGERALMHANRWLVARARRQAIPRASL
jgi:hypothetical protein